MSKLKVLVVMVLAVVLIKCISLPTDMKGSVAPNTKGDESIANSGMGSGKCHLFNSKRKLLSFNHDSSSFKFSVEGENAELDENELDFIGKDNLNNIHSQLTVANQLFQNVLMLDDPISTQRYDKAKFINITLESSDKIFGTAYDEVVTNNELGLSNCFIGMKMSDKVNATQNVTPAHELFHLYQNSAMMFKQSWLSEGTARWSESLIKEGTGKEEALPENIEELLEVMDSSYGASRFWTRLFRLIGNHPKK